MTKPLVVAMLGIVDESRGIRLLHKEGEIAWKFGWKASRRSRWWGWGRWWVRLYGGCRVSRRGWVKQLRDEPGAFRELEKTVHRAFQQMADRVVAGILAEATASAEFADDAKKRSLLSALQSPPLNG